MNACTVTGYVCVHPEGHAGPHRARDGREWGGERCDDRHVFWPHHSRCLCGEMKRSLTTNPVRRPGQPKKGPVICDA